MKPAAPQKKWKLLICIANASIELLPKTIMKRYSDRIKKRNTKTEISKFSDGKPSILLDVSKHHQWMGNLKDYQKRGRPDLVHRTLLSIIDSPLYQETHVDMLIETYMKEIIWLKRGVRLPRSYDRFCGLMVNVLKSDLIDMDTVLQGGGIDYSLNQNQWLVKVKGHLGDVLTHWRPSSIITLSIKGQSISLQELAKRLYAETQPVLVVGGFQKGNLDDIITKQSDSVYRIFSKSLSTSAIICRLMAYLELVYGITT